MKINSQDKAVILQACMAYRREDWMGQAIDRGEIEERQPHEIIEELFKPYAGRLSELTADQGFYVFTSLVI